ncbi:MAG: aldo/keto reductase [Planctomycetota bacterium]
MTVPRVPLGADGYTISRMLVGGWQLSAGHREARLDERAIGADLLRMARAGLTTFDCADIYTGVEELFGRFAARVRQDLAADGIELQLHTKFVPDEQALATLRKADVARAIDRSLRRLGVDRLDLVQFAWWDYAVPGYVEVALWLNELRRDGKIRHVGVTNFDVARTQEMLDAGARLVCNQVQYSLLDRRPERGNGTGDEPSMVELAQQRGLGLLAYGTLAGGFLAERYRGRATPQESLGNRSLVKYRLMIDEFGGWERYQGLLAVLREVAVRRGVGIPAVALRWTLDRSAVAGVIVGTFHGGHLDANLAALGCELDDADRDAIDRVLEQSLGPIGDVFGLERDPDGPHSAIMWKNLSRPRDAGPAS